MAGFTLIQKNRTNRAIKLGFILIQPKMPSGNTPVMSIKNEMNKNI